MKTCYITLRSVTFGQRGQRILDTAGIRTVLQRTPKWMEEQGCGYCLKLRWSDCQRALQLLRQQQVPFRKVYLQQDSGLEEVIL